MHPLLLIEIFYIHTLMNDFYQERIMNFKMVFLYLLIWSLWFSPLICFFKICLYEELLIDFKNITDFKDIKFANILLRVSVRDSGLFYFSCNIFGFVSSLASKSYIIMEMFYFHFQKGTWCLVLCLLSMFVRIFLYSSNPL